MPNNIAGINVRVGIDLSRLQRGLISGEQAIEGFVGRLRKVNLEGIFSGDPFSITKGYLKEADQEIKQTISNWKDRYGGEDSLGLKQVAVNLNEITKAAVKNVKSLEKKINAIYDNMAKINKEGAAKVDQIMSAGMSTKKDGILLEGKRATGRPTRISKAKARVAEFEKEMQGFKVVSKGLEGELKNSAVNINRSVTTLVNRVKSGAIKTKQDLEIELKKIKDKLKAHYASLEGNAEVAGKGKAVKAIQKSMKTQEALEFKAERGEVGDVKAQRIKLAKKLLIEETSLRAQKALGLDVEKQLLAVLKKRAAMGVKSAQDEVASINRKAEQEKKLLETDKQRLKTAKHVRKVRQNALADKQRKEADLEAEAAKEQAEYEDKINKQHEQRLKTAKSIRKIRQNERSAQRTKDLKLAERRLEVEKKIKKIQLQEAIDRGRRKGIAAAEKYKAQLDYERKQKERLLQIEKDRKKVAIQEAIIKGRRRGQAAVQKYQESDLAILQKRNKAVKELRKEIAQSTRERRLKINQDKNSIAIGERLLKIQRLGIKLTKEEKIELRSYRKALSNVSKERKKLAKGGGGFGSKQWMTERATWFIQLRAYWEAYRILTEGFRQFVEAHDELARAMRTARSEMHSMTMVAEKYNKVMREMVKKHGVDFSDVGEALYQLGSAGLSAEENIAAVDTALSLVVATEGDARETTKMLASVYNNFGEQLDATMSKQQKFERIGNIIAKTWKDNQMEISEYTQALKHSAAMATKMGVSLEELSAILGVSHNHMIKAGQAGRSLVTMWSKISRSPHEFASAFDIEDQFDFNKPLEFMEIMDKLHELYGKQVLSVNTVGEAFERMGLRGVKQFMTQLQHWDEVREKVAQYTDSLKTLEEIEERRLNSLSKQWKRFLGAFKSQIAATKGFADSITKMLKTFNDYILDMDADPIGDMLGQYAEYKRSPLGLLGKDISGLHKTWESGLADVNIKVNTLKNSLKASYDEEVRLGNMSEKQANKKKKRLDDILEGKPVKMLFGSMSPRELELQNLISYVGYYEYLIKLTKEMATPLYPLDIGEEPRLKQLENQEDLIEAHKKEVAWSLREGEFKLSLLKDELSLTEKVAFHEEAIAKYKERAIPIQKDLNKQLELYEAGDQNAYTGIKEARERLTEVHNERKKHQQAVFKLMNDQKRAELAGGKAVMTTAKETQKINNTIHSGSILSLSKEKAIQEEINKQRRENAETEKEIIDLKVKHGKLTEKEAWHQKKTIDFNILLAEFNDNRLIQQRELNRLQQEHSLLFKDLQTYVDLEKQRVSLSGQTVEKMDKLYRLEVAQLDIKEGNILGQIELAKQAEKTESTYFKIKKLESELAKLSKQRAINEEAYLIKRQEYESTVRNQFASQRSTSRINDLKEEQKWSEYAQEGRKKSLEIEEAILTSRLHLLKVQRKEIEKQQDGDAKRLALLNNAEQQLELQRQITWNLEAQAVASNVLYDIYIRLNKEMGNLSDFIHDIAYDFVEGFATGMGDLIADWTSGFQDAQQEATDLKGELDELEQEKEKLESQEIMSQEDAERLQEINEEMDELNKQVEKLEDPLEQAKEGFKNFFKALIDEINSAIARMLVMWAIQKVVGLAASSGGGAPAHINASDAPAGTQPGLATGGVTSRIKAFKAFSKGGITNDPVMAILGDNPSGKELVIPAENISKNRVDGYVRGDQQPINIVNLLSKEDIAAAMAGAEGQRVVVNHIGYDLNNGGPVARRLRI